MTYAIFIVCRMFYGHSARAMAVKRFECKVDSTWLEK